VKGKPQGKKQEVNINTINTEMRVENVDHLGIVAGIIDEMGIVDEINARVGRNSREKVSAGVIVKAMILNGLGFVSAPLYMFSKFFEGIATEHLLGTGVTAEQINDDRIGNVLDDLHEVGLSETFVGISLKAVEKYAVKVETGHVDSTSFHVHGEYGKQEEGSIEITYGYSLLPSSRFKAIYDEPDLRRRWGYTRNDGGSKRESSRQGKICRIITRVQKTVDI